MGRFQDRNVIVTGGSSGIGRACVQAFAADGARVLAVGRDETRLEETRAGADDPGRVETLIADVAEPEQARGLVREAIGRFGRVHVLVNNAGIALDGAAVDIPEDDWRVTFAVNLDAAFFASQVAARHMVEQGGGAIVNVASDDAFFAEAPLAAYNASKAALVQLTRSMAFELGHLGVRINAVAPGETATAMTAEDVDDDRFRREYLATVPLRRFATPEEQANVILFLASDDASFVTGELIVADGGKTIGAWYYPWDNPPVR